MNASDLDVITGQLSRDTQALQAAFKAWSTGRLNDQQVSHAYVQLGNGCLRAQHQLSQSQVPVNDLINVPDRLRKILEPALAVDPSPAVFDTYEPAIRHVMGAFFRQLKQKQQLLEPARSLPVYPAPSPRLGGDQLLLNAHPPFSSRANPPTSQPRRGVTSAAGPHIPSVRRKPSDSLPDLPASALKPPETPQLPNQAASGQPSPNKRTWSPNPRTSASRRPISASSPEQAMAQLQKNGVLERQASKRYSTRNLGKLGSEAGTMLPTTDVHRTYVRPDFASSNVVRESPPDTPQQSVRRNRMSMLIDTGSPSARHAATSQEALTIPPADSEKPGESSQSDRGGAVEPVEPVERPLTLFLKLNNIIRKGTVPKPPSIAALRLQFVEICDYSPSGEEAFPEILIQDARSGIDYEVTEHTIQDVKEGSLLTLNVKGEEELSMREELKEIRESLKELAQQAQQTAPRQRPRPGAGSATSPGAHPNNAYPNNSYQNNAYASKYTSPVLTGDGKFILEKPDPNNSSLSRNNSSLSRNNSSPRSRVVSGTAKPENTAAIARELEQIKQVSRRTISACQQEIVQLREELKRLATSNITVALSSDKIAQIREKMDAESTTFVQQMEDLSDLIDRQRLDVLSGGYRLTPIELEQVQRLIQEFEDKFKQSEHFLTHERPVWKRVWQAELNHVIESEDWVKHLSALYRDLRADLDNGIQMFALVREANQMPRDPTKREPVLPALPPGEPGGGFNAVFSEISDLNLNSADRVVAMHRAERQHRVKQAMKIEDLVAEMRKFKPRLNGGFEEAEKKRMERDLLTRKLAEESEREGKRQAELLKQQRRAERAKRGQKDKDPSPETGGSDLAAKDPEIKDADSEPAHTSEPAEATGQLTNATESESTIAKEVKSSSTSSAPADKAVDVEESSTETNQTDDPEPSSPLESSPVIRTEVPTIDLPTEPND